VRAIGLDDAREDRLRALGRLLGEVGAGQDEGGLQVGRVQALRLHQLLDRGRHLPARQEGLASQAPGQRIGRGRLHQPLGDFRGLRGLADLEVGDGERQQRGPMTGGGRFQECVACLGQALVQAIERPQQQPPFAQRGLVAGLGAGAVTRAQALLRLGDRLLEPRGGRDGGPCRRGGGLRRYGSGSQERRQARQDPGELRRARHGRSILPPAPPGHVSSLLNGLLTGPQ
jgi:hypothetical protein